MIIGMDWLSPHHVDIMFRKKVVRLHLPNHETLIIYGDKRGANLYLILCIKAQKCLHKKNYVFLAHVVDEAKRRKSTLKTILVACDFLDVFPKDLLGIPPERRV